MAHKIRRVLGEFKAGKLKRKTGVAVTNRKEAVARGIQTGHTKAFPAPKPKKTKRRTKK